MKTIRHLAAAVACAWALTSAPARADADAAAPAPGAPSAGVPPSEPSPSEPSLSEPPPKRRVTLSLPVDVQVGGRVYVGMAADARDGWARRLGLHSARFGVEARVGAVRTVVEADLVGEDLGDAIKDAYVRLDGPWTTRLQAGHFKAPFSVRRIESSWRLPLVDRGLVDDYVVRRNDLGGRRLGAVGAVRPWDGRVELVAGAFVSDKNALEGERAEDVAGRLAVRPWKALELGATAYRAGSTPEPEAGADAERRRQAATTYAVVNLGPFDATVEGLAGRIEQGPFAAVTALAGWTFPLGESGTFRITPIAGAEAIELRGSVPGQGHAVIAGAVLARAEGLKVKIVGERALRPGDEVSENAVAVEIATRF